jgi:hypothetical protein
MQTRQISAQGDWRQLAKTECGLLRLSCTSGELQQSIAQLPMTPKRDALALFQKSQKSGPWNWRLQKQSFSVAPRASPINVESQKVLLCAFLSIPELTFPLQQMIFSTPALFAQYL